jgi:hypothetical protein
MANKKLPLILIFIITFFALGIILGMNANYLYNNGLFQPRSSLLSQCTGHLKGNKHYHATLDIIQNDQKITVPANIGISGSCIHPIHTHEADGLVHIDFPKTIPFTLGDLFDTQGIIFNENQIGSIKTFDGYKITVKVNGETISKGYRNIGLKDRSKISITLTLNKK